MGTITAPALQLHDVGHAFGGFQVLNGVRFDVPQHGLVGLIGPNGSGKTTLFNIVSGFIEPDAGRVLWDSQDLAGCSVEARSRLGLVRTFQTPKVFENLTVLENVMVGLYKKTRTGIIHSMLRTSMARREVDEMAERAQVVCESFNLGRFLNVQAGSLTAGQRRNLELARAQVSNPKLLMLDEPSSGLSPEEVDELKQSLRQMNERGLTILLVSHDMELMTVAQRVHVLSAGEIIASGTLSEVREDTRVQQVYLGVS